jgi:hydroxyacylglutathione hydrolase
MIQIKQFTFNAFQENTYVLYDETGSCIIVDPGCYEKAEELELEDFIATHQLRPEKLLNTHCHVDHVLGNKFVKERYGLKLSTSKQEEEVLRSVKLYAPLYGFVKYAESEVDEYIAEGDLIRFGNSTFEILFVPGHAPGHLAFVNKEQKVCIGGDVLFADSIGRTDLPGGDFDTLIRSIHTKLFALADATVVYPGHGPETTIGKEKRTNPFCALKQ